MNRVALRYALLLAAVISTSVGGRADTPAEVSLQGRLTDETGTPVTAGVKTMTFAIFATETAGTALWAETLQVLSDDDGLWNARLGGQSPLTATVFDAVPRWLEISVDDGVNPVESLPRVELAANPYAYRVSTLDGATGGSVFGDLVFDNDVQIGGRAIIGSGHASSGNYAFVAGESNAASADYCTVSGGTNNSASTVYSTIGGGRGNQITEGTLQEGLNRPAQIGGATIGGGEFNSVTGAATTISGGSGNTATGNWASVGGGEGNIANGDHATVAGGKNITASANGATVVGGLFNQASNLGATVVGGHADTASGAYATTPGGFGNRAAGAYSLAAGRRAKANAAGVFVWADQSDFDFAGATPNEFAVRATGGSRFVTAIDGSGAPTAGVVLAAGAGSWSSLSDSASKEHIHPIQSGDILKAVVELPIAEWNYRSQSQSTRHVGPMAQDFYRLFGLGESERYVYSEDMAGVALAAIQELYRQNREIKDENETLLLRLQALERAVEAR